MKTLIQFIVIGFFSINVHANSLTAASVKDLMEAIDATKFTYTETGMAFGFVNIKSCVYTSSDMIVIKNYCSPKKDYPAKGYTIISRKFGLVEFYQEQLSAEILKRDVRIDGFPENTAAHLKGDLSGHKLPAINNFLEKMTNTYDAACWSTNYSFYTETPDVACYKTDIAEYPAWADETQSLLNNKQEWLQLIKTMEAKFPR